MDLIEFHGVKLLAVVAQADPDPAAVCGDPVVRADAAAPPGLSVPDDIAAHFLDKQGHHVGASSVHTVGDAEFMGMLALSHHILHGGDAGVDIVLLLPAEALRQEHDVLQLSGKALAAHTDNDESQQEEDDLADRHRGHDPPRPEGHAQDPGRRHGEEEALGEAQGVDEFPVLNALQVVLEGFVQGVRDQADGHAADTEYGQGGHLRVTGVDSRHQGRGDKEDHPDHGQEPDAEQHGVFVGPLEAVQVLRPVIHGGHGQQGPADSDADAEHEHIEVGLHPLGRHGGRADSHDQVDPVGQDIAEDGGELLDKGDQAVLPDVPDVRRLQALERQAEIALLFHKVHQQDQELQPHGNGRRDAHSEDTALDDQGVDKVSRDVRQAQDRRGERHQLLAVVHDHEGAEDLHHDHGGNADHIAVQIFEHVPVELRPALVGHTADLEQGPRGDGAENDKGRRDQDPEQEREGKDRVRLVPVARSHLIGADDLAADGHEAGKEQHDVDQGPQQGDGRVLVRSQKTARHNTVDDRRDDACHLGEDHDDRRRQEHAGDDILFYFFSDNGHA